MTSDVLRNGRPDLSPGIYRGVLKEVVEGDGTGLFGFHAAGATVLEVAAGAFRTEGSCRIAGATYAYTRDGDVLTIDPPLVADAEDGTPVESLTPAGEVETSLVAVVDLDMTGDPEEDPRADIPGELAGYYPLGDAAAGAMVDVRDTPYGYEVTGRPTDAPPLSQAFIDVPTIKLHLATGTAPSIPHNTWTTVAGWTVRTANNFDVPMLDGWVPIAETGRYLAVGSHAWVANSTGSRSGRWVERRLDGTDAVLRVSAETPSAGGVASGQVIDSYFLEAGQAISFGVLQTSGAALSLADGPTQTGLLLVRMST